MCGPVLPIIATGLAVAGQGISTISAMHQAQYQRDAALRQAALERSAAQDARDETIRAVQDQYRQMAAEEGRQRVAAAAGGVGVDFGTAADAVDSTRLTGAARISDITAQGARAVRQADAETFGEFFFAKRAFFEEFFHQSFVVFGCGLHEGVMPFVGALFMFGGDVFFLWFASTGREEVHDHAQGVDDGVEIRALIDRELNGQHARTKTVDGLLQGHFKIRFFVIDLIDHEYGRCVVFFNMFPY